MLSSSTTGKLIGLKTLRYGTKTSRSRICLYLNKTVAHVINFQKTITIKNKTKNIRKNENIYETRAEKKTENTRPMIILTQRVVLSNVCPVIPNSEFENILKGIMLIYASK